MSTTLVMTSKERLAGELEKHDKIQDLLLELRILNRFNNGSSLVNDMIARKQEELVLIWGGSDKYKYNLSGEEASKV